jgi:hypothetical protein
MLLNQNHPPARQRRQRTNFTDDTLKALDVQFQQNPYPDINERERLAREFGATEDRIQVTTVHHLKIRIKTNKNYKKILIPKVWFQNKRARYRKKVQKENDKPEVATIDSDYSFLHEQSANQFKKSKRKTKSAVKEAQNQPSPVYGQSAQASAGLMYTMSTPVSTKQNASLFSFGDSSRSTTSNDSAYSSFNNVSAGYLPSFHYNQSPYSSFNNAAFSSPYLQPRHSYQNQTLPPPVSHPSCDSGKQLSQLNNTCSKKVFFRPFE